MKENKAIVSFPNRYYWISVDLEYISSSLKSYKPQTPKQLFVIVWGFDIWINARIPLFKTILIINLLFWFLVK